MSGLASSQMEKKNMLSQDSVAQTIVQSYLANADVKYFLVSPMKYFPMRYISALSSSAVHVQQKPGSQGQTHLL